MGADHDVLVEGVVGVVPDPAIDDLDPFEGGDPVGEDRPDLLLPDVVVEGEVAGLDGAIVVGGTAS